MSIISVAAIAAQELIRVLNRTKGVVEDVVCYSPALGDTCGLIEVPMNAEIMRL